MKITLTFITVFFSFTCFAQKVSLVLNLKQDSTYYLTTNANATITQSVNGIQQISDMLISGKVAHKVTAIKDTVYEMSVFYQSLSMHMNVLGKQINFDSEDGNQNVFSKIMRTMLNKPFIMMISKSGRVLEVKNADQLFVGMFDSIPDIPEASKVQLKSQMQKSYGEKSIKSNFQDAFPMLPANKISLEDKWIASSIIEANGIVKLAPLII